VFILTQSKMVLDREEQPRGGGDGRPALNYPSAEDVRVRQGGWAGGESYATSGAGLTSSQGGWAAASGADQGRPNRAVWRPTASGASRGGSGSG
jgi:hypothetical protein